MTKLLVSILLLFIAQISLYSATHDDHNHGHSEEQHSEQHDDSDNHDDHDKHKEDNDHSNHEDEEEEHIEWTEELRQEFGIKTAVVNSGFLQITRELPGEIDFHLDYLAHVTSRYSGVVKNIYKHVGDTVKKGDTLAVIESNDSLTRYTIKAPISGVIFEKHLTIGESIPDSTEIFKIADPSHLWVNFHIYSDLKSKVSRNDSVIIQSEGGDLLNTKISYIAPHLSKESRTFLARASILSNQSKWVPGMFVTVLYPLKKMHADIVIPKSAIQVMDGTPMVFVKEGHDVEPHRVSLGNEDDSNVVILKGLNKGQEIVTDGSFIIKAEIEKDSFGDGHDH